MHHIDYTHSHPLTPKEARAELQATQTGVLALAIDYRAYAIPISHYYDGNRLFFRLGISPGSRKASFIEQTESACYLVVETEETTAPKSLESRSVVVTGTLREIVGSELDRFTTATINEQFTPLRVYDEEIELIDIKIFELEQLEIQGRST